MKKILIFLGVVILITIWYVESRSFFCVGDGKCITVWKTYSKCYIIPGKYYGLLKPSDNVIELSKSDVITVFFSDSIPNTIIYKSDRPVRVTNENKEKILLVNYADDLGKMDSLLYIENAKKNSDVKSHVQLMDVILEDNYVVDKNGKKL
jgi:hypothetical protein